MVTLSDQEINNILRSATTIAVVGASRKPWRDSNSIMHFLMEAGYTVFPVNPTYDEISGVKCYASLLYIPAPIDIVNIFRKPEAVMTIVEDAIAVRAKTILTQLGIIHEEAASAALRAGMKVIMDRCIAVEYRHFSRAAM